MAGAMRKMGIYLGLVEDDDARAAYGRYDARQSEYDDRDDRHAGGHQDAVLPVQRPAQEDERVVPM